MIKPDKDWPRGMAPPEPPPIRQGDQSSEASNIAIFIIVSLAVGIACGWQMHGGICS